MVADPVQAKLLDIIAAKKKGRKPVAREKETPPSSDNVINILDALRKSIATESKPKKP
jgi:DNA end-binding protein Ku